MTTENVFQSNHAGIKEIDMYRLLIAEDDLEFLDTLVHRVRWADLNISLINHTTDGLQAMKMIEQSSPDLCIINIRMSPWSGIELLQWIQQRNLPTICLMIAGSQDYLDAQQSLRLGAYDIILKSSSAEDIFQMMQSVSDHLDQKIYSLQELSKFQENMNANPPVVKEEALLSWLLNSEKTKEDRSEKSKELSLKVEPAYVEVGLMRFVIDTLSTKKYEDTDMNLIRYAAANILHETLISHFRGQVEVLTTHTDMVWIANSRKNKDAELMTQLRLAVHNVERFLGLATIIVSGPTVIHLDELHHSYTAGLQRMDRLHFKGTAGCFLERAGLSNPETFIAEENKIDELKPIEIEIYKRMTTQSYALAIDMLEQWFMKLKSSKEYGREQIEQRALHFVSGLQQLIHGKFKLTFEWNAMTLHDIERFPKVDSFEEMSAIIRKMIRSWVQHQSTSGTFHIHVKSILQIIHERYFANLTLDSLAHEVVTPHANLGQLFKQEVGMDFLDYVHHYRVEQAKAMLVEADATVLHVAKQVGYKDERNFSYVFKKWTGLTPLQYQNVMK
jgi:two-component system response regulator YesN